MQTKLNPYLSFKGNAREAIEFYQFERKTPGLQPWGYKRVLKVA